MNQHSNRSLLYAVVGGYLIYLAYELFRSVRANTPTTMPRALMIIVMLPFFMFAMYERHGQPLEVLMKHFIQARFIRPRIRVYQTENFYATIEQNIRKKREVRKILHGKEKGKNKTDPG